MSSNDGVPGASENPQPGDGQPQYPQYPQQQPGQQPQYPPPGYGPPPTNNAGKGFSIAAIVLGVVAILFIPIVFGVIGIILAAVAKKKNESLANIALAVAIGGTVLGFILGAVVYSSR